ncbi:hypothetical protein MTO96_026543 [Rhipicephalus appendiculatus]
MSSFMRRHFKWYGMICKSSGILFLNNSKTSGSDEEVFSWNKFYLIYSVACISVTAFLEICFFYSLWLDVLVHELVFTTTLYVLIYIVDAAKTALNVTLPFVKARSLHNLFYESSKYEQRVRFIAPKNRRKLTCITGSLLFYVHDAAPFLVLRPCCEVIRLYIEHQHGVLRYIVRSGRNDYVGPEKRARLVEKVRLNLCTVLHIRRSLNEIWEHAIAVSGAMVLWASCNGIYLNFVEEFWTPEHLLSIMYTASTVLDFLDITILSDAMVREVIYLRDCLKPGEMALSGAGFFSMKLPTLVSLAGAVITYTVILVQTSESVKKG